jgi:hypothetical protein
VPDETNSVATGSSSAPVAARSSERVSRIKQLVHRPFVVTLRKMLFRCRRRWKSLWLESTPPKPPHWIRDILDMFDWINLLPTFWLMALASRHFFRRTRTIRRYGSDLYKTPIKFVVSAIPFIVGLHWLSIGSWYRDGLYFLLDGVSAAAAWGAHEHWISEHTFSRWQEAILGAADRLKCATDIHLVSTVLVGTPLWIPLVSCLVAVVLLLPRLFEYTKTRQILFFLVSADPRTYFRIRIQDYVWNMLYFAVYFLLVFPFCLLFLFEVLTGCGKIDSQRVLFSVFHLARCRTVRFSVFWQSRSLTQGSARHTPASTYTAGTGAARLRMRTRL